MSDQSREEITKIVRQILKESGRNREASGKSPSPQQAPSRNGPSVLNVFHAGVRKLDEALKQVQQIEETARRSSVYTVESARSWVCGADVKEGAGIKCILDTVKPEGVEKALQKADILVLPTFCLRTAAKVSNLVCDDQESNIVFTALLQGKKVLAANDGFMLCDILVNERLRQEIDQILKKLEGFGVVFCPTEQLSATFGRMLTSDQKPEAGGRPQASGGQKENNPDTVRLITAKTIHTAVDNGRDSIRLAPGGAVTPLAADLAKEYSIKIIKGGFEPA